MGCFLGQDIAYVGRLDLIRFRKLDSGQRLTFGILPVRQVRDRNVNRSVPYLSIVFQRLTGNAEIQILAHSECDVMAT